MPSEKGWLGSARLISGCTLLSRVLGLFRDVLMAAFFGTSVAMDAFVLAFMVPNLFRRLFGEGAMSAAFVPVFTDYTQRDDPADAGRFLGAAFTTLMTLLGIISVLAWLLCMLAPRWLALNATWRLFFPLLQVVFPYMPLICLTALAGAALNVRRHFLAPALAPVLLNVCWIGGLLLGASQIGVFAVAFAVLVGGVVQLCLVLSMLRRHGLRLGLRWQPMHDGVRRVARLIAPMLLGLAAMQINVVVDGLIAQFCVPGSGANSALYYGNRLVQFPLGVFGAAIATAVFPTLASRAHAGDHAGLTATVRQAVRTVLFIALPATAIAVALRVPIVTLVFRRGDFNEVSAARTASVLMFYSLGLAAYCANQVLTRVYYAFEDTRTPVMVASGMVLLNFALNITLVWTMQESGLALATAVCSFVSVGILLAILRRRLGRFGAREVALSGARSLLAAVLCGAAAWVVSQKTANMGSLVHCALPMVAGGAVFLGAALVLRMPEVSEVLGTFARRKRSADSGP